MSDKIKICHCLWSDTIGGIGKVVEMLTVAQHKTAEVAVLFGKSKGAIADRLEQQNVEVHALNLNSGFDLNPAKMNKAIALFTQYDIIHIHSFNYIILWAAIRSKKKIVFTFHSLTDLRRKLNYRDHISKRTLNHFLHKHIHAATTVSEFSKQHIQRFYTHATTLRVVNNCTPPCDDIASMNREKMRASLGLKNDDFVMLCYGRMVKNKRMDMLIEVVSSLNQKHPEMKCLLVGDGPQKTQLINTSKEKGLKDKVLFHGFTDRIFDFVNMADICVFPFHAETFGLGCLESMSKGKIPLVLTDGGGLAEIMAPVNRGKFVLDNAAALIEQITFLINHPEKIKDASASLQARAKAFSAAKIMDDYHRIYSEVLATA